MPRNTPGTQCTRGLTTAGPHRVSVLLGSSVSHSWSLDDTSEYGSACHTNWPKGDVYVRINGSTAPSGPLAVSTSLEGSIKGIKRFPKSRAWVYCFSVIAFFGVILH